jgi:inorganic pyrophosphatase
VLVLEDEAGGDEKIVAVSHLVLRAQQVMQGLATAYHQASRHFFEQSKYLERGRRMKVVKWGDADFRPIVEGVGMGKI